MATLHNPTFLETINQKEAINLNPVERYISAASGAYLVVSGVRGGWRSGFRTILGAEMLRRAFTGHCYAYQAVGINTASKNKSTSVPYELGVHVRMSLTINKPREEVYRFWRNFSNLPKVMTHLIAVEELEDGKYRWTVEGPMGKWVHWDAEIINEAENERIGWRSLPGSEVDNAGSVQFRDAPAGRGTEVRVELQYNPPAGFIGAMGAKLFGRDGCAIVESDCRRLKRYMETGEIPTTEGQPQGPSKKESKRERHQYENTDDEVTA